MNTIQTKLIEKRRKLLEKLTNRATKLIINLVQEGKIEIAEHLINRAVMSHYETFSTESLSHMINVED